MIRALKAVALLVFVAGVVAGVVLIAAWPLGATPSPRTALTGDGNPGADVLTGDGPAGAHGATNDGTVAADPGSGDAAPGAMLGDGRPQVTMDPLPDIGLRPSRPAGVVSTPAPPQPSPTRHGSDPTTARSLPRKVIRHPGPDPATSGLATAVRAAADEGVGESVIAIDRRSGQVVAQTDPDRPLPSMSLVKLFIAVDLLDDAGGPQNLDPQTADTLWQMITVSDDDAASRLWVAGGEGAIVERAVQRFRLTGVRPPDDPRMWGDTTITARDVATFLHQALADPAAGPWLASAMQSAHDTGADGFDQDFGMNTIDGAGSKQGWGCCLRGVRSLDSAGFTDDLVVVALGYAAPVVDDATMRSDLSSTVHALLR